MRLWGGLRRLGSALFARGGDLRLPGNNPGDPDITVSVPTGILRDATNQNAIITGIWGTLALFGVDAPFGITEEDATKLYGALAVVWTVITGIVRTRATNITRG